MSNQEQRLVIIFKDCLRDKFKWSARLEWNTVGFGLGSSHENRNHASFRGVKTPKNHMSIEHRFHKQDMSTLWLCLGLVLAVCINGEINNTTELVTTDPTTVLYNEQSPTGLEDIDESNKPSKFDEDISDKIYVDAKDIEQQLLEEAKRRNESSTELVELIQTTIEPVPSDDGTPSSSTTESSGNNQSEEANTDEQIEKNEISKRRRKRQIWQVRRYVRFPGPGQRGPWDLPPPVAPLAARSPRLVFRDQELPSNTQAAPVWSHNSLLPEEPQQGCGVSVKSQTAQRRIVGGDEAGFGSFPWQAYIRIGSSRCGGSLVNRYHVVTAGHCVARANARQVQVTLGDYVINSAVEPLPAYTYGVRQISVHPYFKFTPQADRFDVAVLRLDRPVQYMPHIAPICLPTKGEDFLGQYGWAAGWGALQPGSRLRPKTLQAVDVPVIDNRLCERWHRSNGINVVIYDEMLCAGYRGGGKDSCQGDSGGPLMLERSGRWFLIGIVSAGYSCAQKGQPGIYHRVANTVDWISHIINS
ncbi:hypothetical protein GE061_017933 [Apolygus lucorum]|uniref:Peptidase S1 domain-containing protein n=1 Tax=Apolygus lucorum TaxID=248454 RepID=A0A8S9XCG1_APOLU|nr:hypothetical protein GE061_017933 [Apolygus lucorum]